MENYVPPSAMQTMSRRQTGVQLPPPSSRHQPGPSASTSGAAGAGAAPGGAGAGAAAASGAGAHVMGQSRGQVLARGASPSVPLAARRGPQNDFQAKLKRLYKKLSSKGVGIYSSNKVLGSIRIYIVLYDGRFPLC